MQLRFSHTHTHARTHARTYAHTHTLTHTLTHIHKYNYIKLCDFILAMFWFIAFSVCKNCFNCGYVAGGGGGGGGLLLKENCGKVKTKRINQIILIAKMCISMYKKTNAFLPLSMIKRKLNISSDSEMFKNENCAHCIQAEEAYCSMYMSYKDA